MQLGTKSAVIAAMLITFLGGGSVADADPVQDLTTAPVVNQTVGTGLNIAGQSAATVLHNPATAALLGITP